MRREAVTNFVEEIIPVEKFARAICKNPNSKIWVDGDGICRITKGVNMSTKRSIRVSK